MQEDPNAQPPVAAEPVQPEPTPPQDLEPEEQALANPPEEPGQPETPEIPEEPEQPAEPAQPDLSRRAVKRLEKLEGLIERIKGPQQQPQRKAPGIDYQKLIEAEPEVYDQLTKASVDYGQNQYEAGLQAANSVRFHTRLEIDAPRVETKYPQFDKSSPEFNPDVASAMNNWYLAMVGYDPQTDSVKNADVRYGDFVEGVMELAEAMAGAKTARTTENVARQAANAGLRPDGSSAKPLNWQGKDPSAMNEKELNAAIAATMPRDGRGRFTSPS